MSILIKNGTIVDGQNNPRYKGFIYIEEEKIKAVMPEDELYLEDKQIFEESADYIIDAKGLIVAPGFIDTHSHSDLKVLEDPALLPKLMQGITTEVLGQDGISMAPLPIQYIESWKKNLAGLDGVSDRIDWTYETCSGYFQQLEAVEPAINETYLLPHGNVRMEAIGLSGKDPDKKELEQMCAIVRREMEAGCIGLSSGLIYIPCAYSETEELIALCKVVKEYDGIFVVHQRSEADDIISSMEEVIRIGIESGVDIHFSHFKVCGKKNWNKLDQVFLLLDKGKEKGLKITFDQYPYPAGSTMLGAILPPWAHEGGTDCLVERLADPVIRSEMTKSIEEGIEGWDNFVDFVGVENIYITSVVTEKNQDVIKLNLVELGKKKNKSPLEAAYDLLMEEKNGVGMVDFYGNEEHIIRILKRKEMNVCTDGLLSGLPHPRTYGSFPRILRKYVREESALSLEEAVWKMTYKAAQAMHITDRGLLKIGNYADIVLFDKNTVADRGSFSNPAHYPKGIEYVIVNGEIVVDSGQYTRKRCGKLIKKPTKKILTN